MEIEEDAWKNFEASGRITDYLNYRDYLTTMSCRWQESEQLQILGNPAVSHRGCGNYGTKHCSNRDGIECHADWRL